MDGDGRDDCRRSRLGSSWRADHAREAAMRLVRAGVCALAAVLSVAPARAEHVVRWATTADAATFDPHAQDLLQTDQMIWQVYDALVCSDWQADLEPCLAVSWKLLDPQTWEFTLREGVTFQDGTPFTAEDVVFSLERAKSETSAFRPTLSNVVGIEAPDAHTVRIKLAGSDSVLLDPLRFVRIMSKRWAKQHGAERPVPPDDSSAYTFAHANGTGPFTLESFQAGVRTVLRRNPGWWDRERSPLDIDRLEQIKVATPEQGLDLLLKGGADFLDTPPLDQVARIAATPGLVVKTGGIHWI